MKFLRGIMWQLIVLAVLLLADIGWRVWEWTHPRAICESNASISGTPFMVMADHRSNVDAISLRRDKSWTPVWAEWDFDQDGVAETASYFLDGRNVFNVNLRPGKPPRFDVYIYGPGKSVTWWLDRGDGSSFTDRIIYGVDGNLLRHEVLQGQTWRAIEISGGQKGVAVEDRWIPLQTDDDMRQSSQLPATSR